MFQSVFLPLFQIWWWIRHLPLCLSLCPVYSCLPPHTVLFPHRRRGELEKKKVFQSCPKISSDYCSLHAPICPFGPSRCLAPTCSGSVELLSPYQPNRNGVAAASRPLRVVSGPRLERAGGSLYGRHWGLPPLRWLWECASVSVYPPFSHHFDSVMKNMSTVEQFNKKCFSSACLHRKLHCPQLNVGLANGLEWYKRSRIFYFFS